MAVEMSTGGIQRKVLDNDPFLDKVQMGLASPGLDINQIMAQPGAAGTGKNIMNSLVGMMAHGSSYRGGATPYVEDHSPGPAIGAAVAGISMGVATAALVASTGNKAPAPPKSAQPPTPPPPVNVGNTPPPPPPQPGQATQTPPPPTPQPAPYTPPPATGALMVNGVPQDVVIPKA